MSRSLLQSRESCCQMKGSRKCSRCRQTIYCSVECQRKDWSAHSVICKPLAIKEQNSGHSPSEVGGRTCRSPGEVNGINCSSAKVDGKTCRSPSEVEEKIKNPKLEASPVSSFLKDQEMERKITFQDLQNTGLNEGSKSQGIVVEFSSPRNFIIQLYTAKTVESLIKVTALLKEIYSKPENLKKGYTPALGEVCVAKFSQDQNWYRVLVQNIDNEGKTADVLYLDYGNTENVSLGDMQKMHKDVDLFPPTAIRCFLADAISPPCGWTPECLVDVKKLLMGKEVTFTVLRLEQVEPLLYGLDVTLPALS
ncbi:hypothetical protein GDO86_018617 [Hymenochirus boettgeri]|uniref:Tudor domain-containing protein 1 n=1 Tax=Hymenochirus boettgeri TaxID=247094 RepID=A0A8T2IKW8_9PIPI|nr:hypothetical protein GDO86_018617 [Hymenochirus boettgeri]